MPMASANATPRIMLVWMAARASGLRPRASIALPTRLPMASAGPKPPTPIAMAAPSALAASVSRATKNGRALKRSMSDLPPLHLSGGAFQISEYCEQALVSLDCPSFGMCGVVSVGPATFVSVVVLFVAVVLNRTDREDKRQHREHRGLDEPHEELQPIDDVHEKEWHQERQHEDQDLAREHVSEETEGEADHADELREEFEDADKRHDAVEVEELLEVTEAERLESPELDAEEGDDGQRERVVHIAEGAAEERNDEPELLAGELNGLDGGAKGGAGDSVVARVRGGGVFLAVCLSEMDLWRLRFGIERREGGADVGLRRGGFVVRGTLVFGELLGEENDVAVGRDAR